MCNCCLTLDHSLPTNFDYGLLHLPDQDNSLTLIVTDQQGMLTPSTGLIPPMVYVEICADLALDYVYFT
jgi:hypothetical protein